MAGKWQHGNMVKPWTNKSLENTDCLDYYLEE